MKLRLLARALLLVSAPGWVSAQKSRITPRVDGAGAAGRAEVVVNEVDSDRYPDVLILATVLIDGIPLTGLGAEDFRVREDEVDQAPLTVEPKLPPLSVVVAVDASGSMANRMEDARLAAKSFVTSLGDLDGVQLLRFAREIDTPTTMTSTKEPVLDAIDATVARGDTALYDGLIRSIDLLADRPGRRAVVVLSDGVDDDGTGQPLSTATIEDVLARAAEVNVPIYAIGLGTEMDEAVLIAIAETTGARYLNAPDASELSAIYARIGDQLSGQYAIRYTSNLPADGIERRVDLAALGAQGSKLHIPSVAPVRTDTGCAAAQALQAERDKLQKASDRHSQNFITTIARNTVRIEASTRILAAIETTNPDRACLATAFAEVKALHDEDLIATTDRNEFRDALLVPVSREVCKDTPEIQEQIGCLTFARELHDASLISTTDRNALRNASFENLIGALADQMSVDDGLALIGQLHGDNLVDTTQRNSARDLLLASEDG